MQLDRLNKWVVRTRTKKRDILQPTYPSFARVITLCQSPGTNKRLAAPPLALPHHFPLDSQLFSLSFRGFPL